ncbi:MAG: glycoside hydrolase family 25 protein [Ruminococcus sp.]|nr:glycoside hydrolase family 25 protein [Ruminococcus sp.]
MEQNTCEKDLRESVSNEGEVQIILEEKNKSKSFSIKDFYNRSIKKHMTPLAAILLVIVLVLTSVLFIQGGSVRMLKKDLNNANMLHRAVYDKSQKIELAGESDRIHTYNIAYGDVCIPAIEGVPKSTYKDEDFITDENGFKQYYIDGELCSYVGVDVSEHNGYIDWQKVRDAGVDFAMLRIGGRGWGEAGVLYGDSMFWENLRGAKAAGLMVGAYFYSQAISAEEAKEEAEFVLEILDGESLDYPIAFDWETVEGGVGARTDNLSPDILTECARAFCDRIKYAGYTPCLYTGATLAYYKYDLGVLSDIDIWYAFYNDTPGLYYNYMIWQYASDGRVSGISGDVDLNICFKNYK